MGGLKSLINGLFLAKIESGNIVYSMGDLATPASGAPGAYAQLRADVAAAVDWWFCGLHIGNLSAAGPAVFNFQVARVQDGSGTDICNTIDVLLLATTTEVERGQLLLPYPVKVAAGVGAAIRQTTASGQTLDVECLYAIAIGT